MLTNIWLVWAVCALFSYSLWGILNGYAIRTTDPYSSLFYSAIGYLIISIFALKYVGYRPELSIKGSIYGFSLGFFTGLGGLFLLIALNRGGATGIVLAVAAVYPLVALLAGSYLLEEYFSLQQFIGVILTILGVILISI